MIFPPNGERSLVSSFSMSKNFCQEMINNNKLRHALRRTWEILAKKSATCCQQNVVDSVAQIFGNILIGVT